MILRIPGTKEGWYINSWLALDHPRGRIPYENTYNVKMILANSGKVTHIKFPSEIDAIMFMLRWG